MIYSMPICKIIKHDKKDALSRTYQRYASNCTDRYNNGWYINSLGCKYAVYSSQIISEFY